MSMENSMRTGWVAGLTALMVSGLAACAVQPQTAPVAAVSTASADPAAALEQLFAEFWEESLKLHPLSATFIGDARYNDQLPNSLSAEYRAREHAFEQRWMERIEAVDVGTLSSTDRLSVEMFRHDRREFLDGERFADELIPLNQFYGFPATLARLGSGASAQPFATIKDYDNWLARGEQAPALFDQAIANMREGMSKGVVLPKVLVEKVIPQLDALIFDDPAKTLFWRPIENLPDSFGAAERGRLSLAYAQMIGSQLMPAYKRLRDFLRDEYLPKSRSTVGLDALPDGAAWYAFNVRSITTTDLTPAQIHQIGLDEVARIHKEMRRVIAELGFKGDMQAFFEFLAEDKQFQYPTEQALLDDYNSLRERVDVGADKLFSTRPKAGFEIRPVEAFRAKSAAGGSYQRPSEDGSRPGIFYVNTYDLPSRNTWDSEDLYLHEAIPGHHFQLAIQQELKGIPAFRRFGSITAFIEGWGLYAETLGKELGVYTDPYSYFGYLQNELWRAIRLVVDTGLHSKQWTREQVIRYMLDNSASSETQAVAEAERYMAIPGQALAYKIGQLRISELRARAEEKLGKNFDIRGFHAEVLKDGAVPLDVLEQKIERWIGDQAQH